MNVKSGYTTSQETIIIHLVLHVADYRTIKHFAQDNYLFHVNLRLLAALHPLPSIHPHDNNIHLLIHLIIQVTAAE